MIPGHLQHGETGLFYCLLPNSTLATGPVSGKKKQKERITIALCANATGTDKLVPLVIGKSAHPQDVKPKYICLHQQQKSLDDRRRFLRLAERVQP